MNFSLLVLFQSIFFVKRGEVVLVDTCNWLSIYATYLYFITYKNRYCPPHWIYYASSTEEFNSAKINL